MEKNNNKNNKFREKVHGAFFFFHFLSNHKMTNNKLNTKKKSFLFYSKYKKVKFIQNHSEMEHMTSPLIPTTSKHDHQLVIPRLSETVNGLMMVCK